MDRWKKVFHQRVLLKGADSVSFQYDGIFAKDNKKCFCGEMWLKDTDVETFRLLNYTYAIDKNRVFTITGKVKDADIETFEVLDDGKRLLWYNRAGLPEYTLWSYAKDKNNIYYHNYEGKPKVVKNADLKTFVSLNDGYFAKDKFQVYGNGKPIKNADIESWSPISEIQNCLYSKDEERIFYGFWDIKADYDTFELVVAENARYIDKQLAKDRNNFFKNGEVMTAEEFEKNLCK